MVKDPGHDGRERPVAHYLTVLFVLLVIPLSSAVWAQAGQQPTQVDFFTDLWVKVQQAGPFAAMISLFFLWRSEKRSDRLLAERDGLLERVIVGLTNSTATVDGLNKTLERSTAALAEATKLLIAKSG